MRLQQMSIPAGDKQEPGVSFMNGLLTAEQVAKILNVSSAWGT